MRDVQSTPTFEAAAEAIEESSTEDKVAPKAPIKEEEEEEEEWRKEWKRAKEKKLLEKKRRDEKALQLKKEEDKRWGLNQGSIAKARAAAREIGLWGDMHEHEDHTGKEYTTREERLAEMADYCQDYRDRQRKVVEKAEAVSRDMQTRADILQEAADKFMDKYNSPARRQSAARQRMEDKLRRLMEEKEAKEKNKRRFVPGQLWESVKIEHYGVEEHDRNNVLAARDGLYQDGGDDDEKGAAAKKGKSRMARRKEKWRKKLAADKEAHKRRGSVYRGGTVIEASEDLPPGARG